MQKQKHAEFLADNSLKLSSITKSEDTIINIYQKYTSLLNVSNQQNCFARAKLINIISSLHYKYNLAEPISISVTHTFLNNITKDTTIVEIQDSTLKIKNYDIRIKFATPDFKTILDILKDIYSYMPENTIVMSLKIQKQSVLEPKVIYKLSPQRLPDMLYTKFNLLTREITVDE